MGYRYKNLILILRHLNLGAFFNSKKLEGDFIATENRVRVLFEAMMNNFNNNINNSLNSAEDRFSQFSNKISRLLKVAFTGAVAKTAFDQLFKNPLKVSADFEAQMSNVKALISSSSKNLEKDMEDLNHL